MNIAKFFINVGKLGKMLVVLMLMVSFAGIAFAAGSGVTNLQSALVQLCASAKAFLGVAAMLLVVLGAIVYAAGQVMGAETRARSTVWATAMFTGAMIGILIYIIVPPILQAIIGGGAGAGSTAISIIC